jgi:hypothetical protein
MPPAPNRKLSPQVRAGDVALAAHEVAAAREVSNNWLSRVIAVWAPMV